MATEWKAPDQAVTKVNVSTEPTSREGVTATTTLTREALARAEAGELLNGPELAAIFRLKHTQFHRRERAGAFDRFKVNPPIGNKKYSGVLVMRYLRGEPVYEPTFGRKRGPREKLT